MQRKPFEHSRASKRRRPPRLADWLLRCFSPRGELDGLLGDLHEEYRRHRLPLGVANARRWYWGQVLASLVPGLDRPQRRLPDARKGDGPVTDLLQDIRYGVRSLLHAPTFTVMTLLTLMLAIGINTAIFSMVSVVFFSDMPLVDPESAVFLFMESPDRGVDRGGVSPGDFLEFRDRMTSLKSMAAAQQRAGILSGVEEPTRVRVAAVTANMFRVWGLTPRPGRDFLEGEDAPGAERVVVLSHGLWERRFGTDPSVVGRVVKLDGHPTTIVGVADERLEYGDLAAIDLWVPLALDPNTATRSERSLIVTGRLAPGATVAQAHEEALAIGGRLQQEHPETNRGWTPNLMSFDDGMADRGFWTLLSLLGITIGLVMLLACSNVATLTLARATGRSQELAVRAALGAGRKRILRQLVTESILLSVVAGALGLLVAKASLMGLTWMVGDAAGLSSFFAMLAIDRQVLLFTLAVSLAAPLLFGLLPALRAARGDLARALRENGRTSGDVSTLRGRRMLVATQVALAIMLMVVAGLLIHGMSSVRSMDLGHDTDQILTMRVDLPEVGYAEPQAIAQFRTRMQERVQAIPGVVRAAWVSSRPMADGVNTPAFEIEGEETREGEQGPWALAMRVGPAYFDMLRLRPLQGRLLARSDDESASKVAVVNAQAVERFWSGDDPIGQRVRIADGDWHEIVGVVSDERYPDPTSPLMPQIYLPMAQKPSRAAAFLVETVGDPMAAVSPIREAARNLDPELPLADVRTQARIYADSLASLNTVATMFGAFAFFALVMATAGIYGVLSFVVAQRTREIGIRMALGARGGDVRGLIMRSSGVLVLLGAGIGLVGAYLLARLLASGLPEINALNPTVYGTVAVVLTLVGGLAAWIPARRATRVEPVIALRAE